MKTHSRSVVLLAAVFALAVVGGFALVASDGGIVAADHGAEDADYSVEPMEPEDRQPGATGVRYGQIVVAQAGVDLETIERMEAVYEGGSWASCGPEDGEVFGIDRGNTLDGYEVDEGLEENTQSFSAGEDVFQVDFYGENDFGSSTHFDDGDALVSVADCLQNPEEPGWYQISGSTTGVTADGEERTFSSESHYFWICDCEDEDEAREELGPPPSEESAGTDGGDGEDADEDAGDADAESGDETTDGDAETADDGDDGTDDGDGTADDADGEQAGGGDAEADDAGGEGATGDSDGSSADGEDSTPADQSVASEDSTDGDGQQDGEQSGEQNWDQERVQTPTPAEGDGFGAVLALAGVLGAMLLLRRR